MDLKKDREMNIKLIKNKQQHAEAKKYLKALARENSDLFDVQSLVIKHYEDEQYLINMPDPITAIKFRMEESELSRKDLVPIVGSEAKISEILNGRSSLSLKVIRSLHQSLGIPYDVLMQEIEIKKSESEEPNFINYPLSELFKAKAFPNAKSLAEVKANAKDFILNFYKGVDLEPALLRSNAEHYTNSRMNRLALDSWRVMVLQDANKRKRINKCDLSKIDLNFMRKVLKLSRFKDGPLKAVDMLSEYGIHLVFRKHLARTYLDGAAMWDSKKKRNPVIGMTIRYDRLDNFWFVLMHELAHVSLHLKDSLEAIFDDLEGEKNDVEDEADQRALEALMPEEEWDKFKPILLTPTAVSALAEELGVHPAIIAGRYRKEAKDFRIFNRLIGSKEVRNQVYKE